MKRLVILTVALVSLLLVSTSVFAQSTSRTKLLQQINAKQRELTALETEFLSPTAQDKARYAELVRGREGGLIRLLPRETYDKHVRQTGISLRGGGAYYSFSRLTHEYGYGSDISLERDGFSTGFAGADYGMLVSLGDVPFNKIDQDSPAVKFVTNYQPPLPEPAVRIEQRRFAEGVFENGVPLKRSIGAQLNTTYLVRSINFDDSDVLVAFRPVRRDVDGSLIIAWTMLKRFPAPQLFRQAADAR